MIDISRVGVSQSKIFDTYKEDLLTVFEGYETYENNIYLNADKTMYLTLEKDENYDTPSVTLWYNGNGISIEGSAVYSFYSYHFIKFDNGVIAWSKVGAYEDISQPTPYATNYGYVTRFLTDCENIATQETEKSVLITAGDSTIDNNNIYRLRAEKGREADFVRFASVGDDVINSAMTVIVPVYGHSRPLTTDKLWLKLQSQQQFGEIVLGGKKYMSCGTFCVPLE